MKKFILSFTLSLLLSFTVLAADRDTAISECSRLGGTSSVVADAFSGESEVVCTFASADQTCGQLQLVGGYCEFRGSNATNFSDIVGSDYEVAIRYAEGLGIVEGYDDGTYQPNRFINRAEFTKIVVEALYDEEVYALFDRESCFPDVKDGQWYTQYVCYAKNVGIVDGNDDGTFKPANLVNYAEGLKIVLDAYRVEILERGSTWYNKYAFHAYENGLSLAGKLEPADPLTRGEMAELIYWASSL